MKFWNFKDSTDNDIVELRIDGEIVDDDSAWLYELFGITAASPNAFRESLNACAGKNLNVWIDSYGGDVSAAAGIYNALKEYQGKVTVKIDGKAVSAASVIAMAGDEIQMSPVGMLMIHNPLTGVQGEAKDLRQVADVLDVVKDTIINAYQLKSGKSRAEIANMMDAETWMSAQKAKAEGFIDEILYSENAQPLENSFNFSHFAIQNSASSAMRRFIDKCKNGKIAGINMEKEEEQLVEIKTIEDLQKSYPDLMNQSNSKAVQDALKNEQGRVSALDALDDPKNAAVHDIITNAKVNGKTVDEVKSYVDIAKKYAPATAEPPADPAKNFMAQVIADNKNSGVDGIKSSGGGGDDNDKQKKVAAVNYMAEIINKKNGVKK